MEQAKLKNSKNIKKTAKKSDATTKSKVDGAYVEVLYQRLGDKWFAFSAVGDDLFFAEVPDSAIETARAGEVSCEGVSEGERSRMPEKDAA